MILYWIHLPAHTSFHTQGYIGITTKSINDRMSKHRHSTLKGGFPINKAIRKYGFDNLVVDILYEGNDKFILSLERALRPSKSIGWNVVIGGGTTSKGNTHSEESKSKMRESRKLWLSDPANVEKVRLLRIGTKASAETRKKMSAAMRGKVCKWNKGNAVISNWIAALDLYVEMLPDNFSKSSVKYKSMPQPSQKYMVKLFRNGWNPTTDLEYLAWRDEQLANNSNAA